MGQQGVDELFDVPGEEAEGVEFGAVEVHEAIADAGQVGAEGVVAREDVGGVEFEDVGGVEEGACFVVQLSVGQEETQAGWEGFGSDDAAREVGEVAVDYVADFGGEREEGEGVVDDGGLGAFDGVAAVIRRALD